MNPFGHGYHLNRAVFDETLRSLVMDYESKTKSMPQGIDVLKGRFTGAEKDSSGKWAIQAEVDNDPKTFLAKWVVDATGRKASFATKVGLPHHLNPVFVPETL
jgi:flavin-dependent dehydrogenase